MTATENKTMATGTILVEKVKYKNVRFYTIIIIIIINREREGKREGGRERERNKRRKGNWWIIIQCWRGGG